MDARHFRTVLGHFPTGVVAVTSLNSDGNPIGMTVGSFTSVSLDPPLVAFLPDKRSSTFPRIRESGRFCVNILSAAQEGVCRQLARKQDEKFTAIDWTMSPARTPRIADSIGWIECEIDSVIDAGDHDIVIGKVLALDVHVLHSPLIFFQGGYGRFASTSLTAPAEADLFHPLRIVDQARTEMGAAAGELNAEVCASIVIGDQLVLIGSSVANSLGTAPHIRLGQRMPFAPPLALPLIAWKDDATIESWVASAGPGVDRALVRNALDRVRSRGWSLVLRSDQQMRFERAVSALPLRNATREQSDELTAAAGELVLDGYEPAELDGDQQYHVRVISVPVFDESGDVVLLLSLYQLPRLLSGHDVNRYVSRLILAAERVTATIGGTAPVHEPTPAAAAVSRTAVPA
ncbi:flavin reductase [Cryobacterium frigoriphilum]|uniref:Flavin reductase n=2 Tax=Cryobacterium frigoriphilum TaxID=1259150 RepID=A0A4V3IQH3_9MICO|nr:flavin reductase [Cryobacterium frigoriphilum]